MKNTLIFIGILALSACSSSAQKTENKKEAKGVPQAVKDIFAKKYPSASGASWEKEEDNNFEAEFEMNEVEYSAVFDKTGRFVEQEMEIRVIDLPQAITGYIETNHKGKKIKEASRIEFADGTINYEAEVQGKDLIFDQSGKFIR